MAYDDKTLKLIYSRTDGYCHICGKKLSLKNYAVMGGKGCWEVEHSHAKANGGSDHLNNLYAACIACNREKGTVTAKTARSWNGLKRAPLSRNKKTQVRSENAIIGVVIGGIIGSIAGPWGATIGASIGGTFGYNKNPNK